MDAAIPNRCQILSLDGGGIKGLFSAAVLANRGRPVGSRYGSFDLITGTSTGGIIALGLGLGMRPKEIVEFYVEHGPQIFHQRKLWNSFCWLFRRKYPPHPLRQAVQQCFEEKLLLDSKKRLFITSYSLDKDELFEHSLLGIRPADRMAFLIEILVEACKQLISVQSELE